MENEERKRKERKAKMKDYRNEGSVTGVRYRKYEQEQVQNETCKE